MAGSRLPLVSGNRLLLHNGPDSQQALIAVGSAAWYTWLTSEATRAFTFKNHLGTFTARREQKRHGWYWYLYHKHLGKLHKAYLGKAEELSLERLLTVVEDLVRRHDPENGSPEALYQSESELPQLPTPGEPDEDSSRTPPPQTLVFSRSASSERIHKQHLPLQYTPLIGREQEVETVCALLHRSDVHLLTLTGTGGIGKTRLGLQVASELLGDFAHGACFVPLAPLRDPELVVSTIAQTLGVKDTGGQSPISLLKAFLQDKSLLLLLDNFEQVLGAAPILSDLLATCLQLKLLVTSRAPLHISGEHEFLVQPLAVPNLQRLPPLAQLTQCAAVALFVQRARMIKPDFQVTPTNARFVAEICVRLDGLPLAIELAAARSKLLSPQALLSRLEHRLTVLTMGEQNAPLRQQTLRNTLSWSYELLDRDEQWLFRHLAIFVGGCQLSAAESLCQAPGVLTTPVFDGVASLVDKNLLQVMAQEGDEPRISMLETVREYGLECLAEAGEMQQTRQAHAATYFSLVMQADAALLGIERETWPMWSNREQERWLDWQEQEYGNLRAALNVLLEGDDREAALQFSVAFANVWFFRGYPADGRRIMERVLSLCSVREVQSNAKGWALYIAGWLAFYQSDERQAVALLKESEQMFRRLQYIRGVAACLTLLGNIEHHHGNLETGNAQLDESLSLYRTHGDRVGIAYALLTRGILVFFRGELDHAQALCEESLALSKEVGHTWLIAANLHYLGWTLFLQGAYTDARRFSEESVTLFKELGYGGYSVEAQIVLANELAVLGDEVTALILLEEALARGRALESRDDIARALCGLGRLALRQSDLQRAQTFYGEAVMILKQEMEIPDRVQWVLASCLEGMGEIALARGQASRAVRLFARAEALRTSDTYRNMIGIEQPLYARLLAEATAQLGEGTFAALWREGHEITTEQALIAQEPGEKGVSSPPSSTKPLLADPPARLTRREFEVLRLAVQGLGNAQIAERLAISLTTVNAYLSSIYSKLGVSSRLGAMRYAIDHHLF